jgi:uncharacterized membrane protein
MNLKNILKKIDRPHSSLMILMSIMVMLAVTTVFFFKSWKFGMPSGADIPSHIFSSKFIVNGIMNGHKIPHINPYWYNSFEVLQNAAVFSYFPFGFLVYFLAKIFGGNSGYIAGHIFYFLGTFIFGLGMYLVLYRRAGNLISLLLALAIMFSPIFQDQVVTGGSISRMSAFVLIPFAFYFFDLFLENKERNKALLYAVIFSFLVAGSILSHPMSGAVLLIFCLSIGLIRIFIDRSVPRKNYLYLIISPLLIIGLTAWYIMPFFIEQQGWITLHDQVITLFSVDFRGIYLNIGGIGFILGIFLVFLNYKKWDKKISIIFFISFVFVIFSMGKFFPLYKTFPFLTEVYPFIFLMLAIFGFYYIIGIVFGLKNRTDKLGLKLLLISILLIFIVNNFRVSYGKIFYSGPDSSTIEVASSNVINGDKGRVFPVKYPFGYLIYWLSVYQKPTVEGWYYSVTPTARHLAWVYDAIDYGYSDFAIRYLELANVRYVLTNGNLTYLLETPGKNNQILAERYRDFLEKMINRGFVQAFDNDSYGIYALDKEQEYLQVLNRRILTIGRTAFSATAILPDSVGGGSNYVDDYNQKTLSHFPYLVLDGFKYHDKTKAEELVREYVNNGGKVIIDFSNLSGNPYDVEYPSFLGVNGYRAIYKDDLKVNVVSGSTGENSTVDMPLPSLLEIGANYGIIVEGQNVQENPFKEWRFSAYYNLENEVAYINKDGTKDTILGYNKIGKGEAWFVGPNLFYYELMTKNDKVMSLVERAIPPDDNFDARPQIFKVENFVNEPEHKQSDVTTSADIPLLLSFVYSPHWEVKVDGQKTLTQNIEDMVMINLPEGKHKVEMNYVSTWPRRYGSYITWGTIFISVAIITYSLVKRRKKK